MDPDRFARLKKILQSMAQLPAEARPAYLDRECGGDPDLRAEVDSTLAHGGLPTAMPGARLDSPTPKDSESRARLIAAMTSPAASNPAGAPFGGAESLDAGASASASTPRTNRIDAPTPGGRPVSRPLASGIILGNRYRIVDLLGSGGMGEVWHAYDLKLQVDVALKSMHTGLFSDASALELLRNEARSAREVISPNVCRIFDLVEEEGHEFVSMEYIDGVTLLSLLKERAPLPIPEATRIAAQFLAGLEAIHQAGLVHRDIKPENIMITRAGRVLLMDFGIARGVTEDQQGTVSGTPAYMAPEQWRGEAVDARADIFSAGVTLAEMIAPTGLHDYTSRKSVWDSVRADPVQLFDSPWRRVLERAVAAQASERYAAARELVRALEEVPQRIAGAEEKRPYPGLACFTEADAEFFFGRELEVEAVWKKLQRTNLLALVGASGAGKSSFLHAGLIPAAPEGWRLLIIRPGSTPFAALGQALVPELAGDVEATQALLWLEDPKQALLALGRWREAHGQVMIVADQFEELFTLCRSEVQEAFSDLLGRLALEADVHILLSMRDDFLLRCYEHPRLAPIFADLTPLGPPAGSALRRAVVQPALLCGYRFDDEALADEMLDAVAGERGALPMLAFAAARLWENRDRESGLLTRDAYEGIGGVMGALAHHAEATLERIGVERESIVREIFRNLVTSQGTRAVPDVDDILSVFRNRDDAREVLDALINARLLTTFELPAARQDGREQRRVEIVHESLLSHWPRLVRWQTQDSEGAQLRDQLRQAAQLWKERGESEDLLWAGTAFKEFELWRERYPGGLTATEEAFARAMVARAGRQRRRRRLALGAAFAVLIGIVLIVGWSWRGERRALRGSEAAMLLQLGKSEIDNDPGAALAYTLAGLERIDTPAARRFAIDALSRGPSALSVALACSSGLLQAYYLDFSPDGKRLAVGGTGGLQVIHGDGSPPTVLQDYMPVPVAPWAPQFAPGGDLLPCPVPQGRASIQVWSLSTGKVVRTFQQGGPTILRRSGTRLWFNSWGRHPSGADGAPGVQWASLHSWSGGEEDPELVLRCDMEEGAAFEAYDPTGRWAAISKGQEVYVRPISGQNLGLERLVGEHTGDVSNGGSVTFDPAGERLASVDASGEIKLWSLAGSSKTPLRVLSGNGRVAFDPTGRILIAASNGMTSPGSYPEIRLWNLDGPVDADPFVFRRGQGNPFSEVAFDPSGQWAAFGYHNDIAFWPLTHPHPYFLHGAGGACSFVAFTPDGQSLLGVFGGGAVKVWDLAGAPTRDLRISPGIQTLALDPRGRFLVGATLGGVGIMPIMPTGGEARRLLDEAPKQFIVSVAISPDGRLAAGGPGGGKEDGEIRIWDLEANTVRYMEGTRGSYDLVAFTPDGSLLSCGTDGTVKKWDLQGGVATVLAAGKWKVKGIEMTRDRRLLFTLRMSEQSESGETWTTELTCYDLSKRTSRSITTHGNRIGAFALDPTGKLLVTTDFKGVTRVGPITGEEPHLLPAPIRGLCVAVSPDGKWIAAGDIDGPNVYLWRTPQGRPFHTLPRAEFLERLRALTYLRAVPDKKSATGYRLDRAPFTGWEKVPNW